MRTSIASLALITRRHSGKVEYLAQWNAAWSAFHLVGGHKLASESFRECVIREIGEELELVPPEFSIGDDPSGHLEFTAFSHGAGVQTAYTFELFEIEPACQQTRDALGERPENAWLSAAEIAAGTVGDGRAISPTLPLVLGKTGRLPPPRRPDVFTIGVTGHRDLVDDRELTLDKLRSIFECVERQAAGHPIEAISPLAAGADQLFAQAALARGYRLIAPLPLPLDLYRHDFRRERGSEFDRLLLRAAEWYSLPLGVAEPGDARRRGRGAGTAHHVSHGGQCPPDEPAAEEIGRADVAVSGPARNAMYEAIGRHVVERSDLLIALWDGQENGKRGGTGEIVAFARRQIAAGQPLRLEVVPVRRGVV